MLSRPDLPPSAQHVLQSVKTAAALIPPAWPLAATVAVNPFMGFAKERFSATSERIRMLTGQGITLPRSWYLDQIRAGQITHEDVSFALSESAHDLQVQNADVFIQQLAAPLQRVDRFRTLLDLASHKSKVDFSELGMDCISNWAATFFDEGQALWNPYRKASAWQDWRIYSRHDLTPEIYGLSRFAERSDETPNKASEFILQAVKVLGLPAAALDAYFHHLLFELIGWSQIARYRQWQAELANETDETLTDLLAIRLFWEVAVFSGLQDDLTSDWEIHRRKYAQAASMTSGRDGHIDEILQSALDRSIHRRLIEEFSQTAPAAKESEPFAQIAFCIDVRSEPMRRMIETCSDRIETIGFAGFFGLTLDHAPFASDQHEKRLPVLLSPGLKSRTAENDTQKDLNTRYTARAVRAWGRFKLAAVSSFAFVEAAGALYLGKLVDQQFLKRKEKSKPSHKPEFEDLLSENDKVDLAATILGAMSLTSGFRELVVLCGHGASVVNNPHETALHCGACGGYAGDVSARLLASLLNDPETRAGLAKRGVVIPPKTLFIGALHDTTTDDITLYDCDTDVTGKTDVIEALKGTFRQAAIANRIARKTRLPGANTPEQVTVRSLDWAQVRPEWGLAGCKSFIAAPRQRTLGRNLGGETFLHSYDWKQDKEFKVLELILTAPVVVASWISLQYFGSTVAPHVFGAGNKVLHNVVGGIGVLEGNGGPMRTGLPIQSVHDGNEFVHLPVRLSIIVEAPIEAINGVLARHENVRDLFDNHWLHLFQMDENGQLTAQYTNNLNWRDIASSSQATKKAMVA